MYAELIARLSETPLISASGVGATAYSRKGKTDPIVPRTAKAILLVFALPIEVLNRFMRSCSDDDPLPWPCPLLIWMDL